MNFTINIDDETLQKSLEQGVLKIDPERVAELAEKAVFEYLQQPRVIESILFEKSSYYSGPDYNNPRRWFENAIEKCFSKEDILPFKDKLMTIVNSSGEAIVVKTMAEVFSKMLVDHELRNDLSVAFAHAIRSSQGG